jgi:hypothetical protein
MLIQLRTLLSLLCVAVVQASEGDFDVSLRRNLQVSTQTIGSYTYTCDLTTKAFSFGGTQDDQIVDVAIDNEGGGEIYACGNTYSTQYSSGDQDIVVFKFEPQTMSYMRPDGWSLVWGGPITETATGIAVDDSSQFVYVSAYTNSENTLSSAKYDMLVLKINSNTGLLTWAKRFGSGNNDKANGITFFNGNIYVIGDSDSVGWTGLNARTDMVFLKIDPSTSQPVFSNFLGGTAEDFGLKIVGHSDGFLYALGQGYSVEYTQGTIDPFIIRFD